MSNDPTPAFRNSIRFVMDGEVIEIDDVDPNRTVLQFLREDLRRTGTKEGCAEGDCGACTVVVASVDGSGERLSARAINSCIQFLPTLDGKELLTVESLADENLHPVQQALVEWHGSQCGFCTPGFVMSLFALYKNNAAPTRRQIDDALAGNLCRCTGYSPIIIAASDMYGMAPQTDDWTLRPAGADAGADEQARVERLKSLRSGWPLRLDSKQKKYFAPVNADELAVLVAAFPTATILAGGTDIGLWVTKQHRDLDVVIYTGNVAELTDIAETGAYLDIGAAVPLSDAVPRIVDRLPDLEEMFVRFASPPIRNAATLGGNVANGSPIGDSMPALLVMDAVLILRKGQHQRTLPLSDFYLGYQRTALQEGEFLQSIRIPAAMDGEQLRCFKVSKRFDQDISAVCGAFRLSMDGIRVADIRVAYGGMAAVPSRALACEAALVGKTWDETSIEDALAALDTDFKPISDMRSSDWYRQQVCKNLLKRFWMETNGIAAERIYSYGR